jgi:hypothetical protein
MNDKLVTQSII